jgi:predicted nucleic acid-binding protein
LRYVLDTNVVSALRVRGRHPRVEAWAESVPLNALFIAATTISEIERGVVSKERSDPAQGAVLRRWFDEHVLPAFAGRVLPFDLSAARVLATYHVPASAPLDDALLAAIGQANSMIIVTRNIKHFGPLGVVCVNPWDHVPDRS